MSKFLFFSIALAFVYGTTGHAKDVSHSLGSTNFVGHFTDELPKSSEIGRFTQPLVDNPKMALEYRIENKQEFVMLLESQESNRWQVMDILKLPKHTEKESISFACAISGEGTPEAGAGGFGVVKQVKKSQVITASQGWVVNMKSKRLEPVQGKKTICDLHGVD